MALVNKLKQYDKTVFVVGGKSVHEHDSAEELSASSSAMNRCWTTIAGPLAGRVSINSSTAAARPRIDQQERIASSSSPSSSAPSSGSSSGPRNSATSAQVAVDGAHLRSICTRQCRLWNALQVLERREVRPVRSVFLLKSTMPQLDLLQRAGVWRGSLHRFHRTAGGKADLVQVTGGEGRYDLHAGEPARLEKTALSGRSGLPALRDVLENHRLEMEEGVSMDELTGWVREEAPDFDWITFDL